MQEFFRRIAKGMTRHLIHTIEINLNSLHESMQACATQSNSERENTFRYHAPSRQAGHLREFKKARDQPGPPSQQVSQIVRQREQMSLALISTRVPPQTGQEGRHEAFESSWRGRAGLGDRGRDCGDSIMCLCDSSKHWRASTGMPLGPAHLESHRQGSTRLARAPRLGATAKAARLEHANPSERNLTTPRSLGLP